MVRFIQVTSIVHFQLEDFEFITKLNSYQILNLLKGQSVRMLDALGLTSRQNIVIRTRLTSLPGTVTLL